MNTSQSYFGVSSLDVSKNKFLPTSKVWHLEIEARTEGGDFASFTFFGEDSCKVELSGGALKSLHERIQELETELASYRTPAHEETDYAGGDVTQCDECGMGENCICDEVNETLSLNRSPGTGTRQGRRPAAPPAVALTPVGGANNPDRYAHDMDGSMT